MPRSLHPNKEIEAAVAEMEAAGWVIHLSAGRTSHAWARAECPIGHLECTIDSAPEPTPAWARAECPIGHLECTLSVYQTPAVAHHEARRLRSAIRRCERRSETS